MHILLGRKYRLRLTSKIMVVLMSAMLAACQTPSTRPINTSSKLSAEPVVSIPRIDCGATLSPADDLTRSVVVERVREGSYYAALAQIQSLPASVPVVAVLRADILRRLKSPEARLWYLAMRDRCVSADADHGLGLLAADAGEHVIAHRYLQQAAKARPNNANFRNDLGFSAMLIGNDQQSEFELRTAYELAREDRTAGFNLMLLSLITGDRATWWRWRERLSPKEAERMDLLKACREVMHQRQTLGSNVDALKQNCPINPLS
jgi:Flp pilus assembly protein TadD